MIKLIFFASLREELGCESLEMEFKEPLRVIRDDQAGRGKKGRHWGKVLAGSQ